MKIACQGQTLTFLRKESAVKWAAELSSNEGLKKRTGENDGPFMGDNTENEIRL
jgi:hypothetical protein